MLINEALRRQIGREALQFCRRCPALAEQTQGEYTVYSCQNTQCRLWAFLRLLGLRPGTDFDGPSAEEELMREHAREARRFRGVLPEVESGHNWEADARYHGLAPDVIWDEAAGPAEQERRPRRS
jgi:hypothetical protein